MLHTCNPDKPCFLWLLHSFLPPFTVWHCKARQGGQWILNWVWYLFSPSWPLSSLPLLLLPCCHHKISSQEAADKLCWRMEQVTLPFWLIFNQNMLQTFSKQRSEALLWRWRHHNKGIYNQDGWICSHTRKTLHGQHCFREWQLEAITEAPMTTSTWPCGILRVFCSGVSEHQKYYMTLTSPMSGGICMFLSTLGWDNSGAGELVNFNLKVNIPKTCLSAPRTWL